MSHELRTRIESGKVVMKHDTIACDEVLTET